MHSQAALGRTGQDREAETRQQMIGRNLPLVRYVLSRMALSLPPHLEEADLAEAGVIGLIRAVQEFDPSRQTRFSTFAVPRIRGAILDELRAHSWVPRSARRKALDVAHACEVLRVRGARAPSIEEIAHTLRTSVSKAKEMLSHSRAATFSSLETLCETDRDGTRARIADTLQDEKCPSPENRALLAEEEELLTQAITRLPHQERVVITLYYFGNLMLKEIADVLGVSKPRISQIHAKALQLLREHIEEGAGELRAAQDQTPQNTPAVATLVDQLFDRARLIAEGKAP